MQLGTILCKFGAILSQIGAKNLFLPVFGTPGTRFGSQRTLWSRAVNGTDENPTGPAIHQGQVTDTSLIWGRVFGNESQQSPRVYFPTGKLQKKQWVLIMSLRCLFTRVSDPPTSCMQKMSKSLICLCRYLSLLPKRV